MAFNQNQIGLKNSQGYIFMRNGGTPINFSWTTSYQEFTSLSTSFALASTSVDFAMTTDGRLKYTGAKSKIFMIDAALNMISNSNENKAVAVRKNGSVITGGECYTIYLNNQQIHKIPVLMATNDYISVWGKSSANQDRTIYEITLAANSISE